MLTVRVIRKFYDNKGDLYAYRIKDMRTGEEMNVIKDELKKFVLAGRVAVDNMTLTSDGRLIGHATPKDRPVARANKCIKVPNRFAECVFTNGKKIACIMVNNTEFLKSIGEIPMQYKGLTPGYTFDVGHEATENIKHNEYSNIKVIDGKPDFTNTKKKSYKQLKERLLKILADNNIHTELAVIKGDQKYEYVITIGNYDDIDGEDVIKQIIYVLIENAMYDNNLKPNYIDEDKFFVSCMTGINDVRKALKTAGIAKI